MNLAMWLLVSGKASTVALFPKIMEHCY